MTQLKKYNYWGNENAPPDNLKTKKQLSELGLRPNTAVGYIHTQKYTLFLYDINNPESVKPKKILTQKQKEALEKARLMKEYKKAKQKYLEDVTQSSAEIAAIKWAKNVLSRSEKYIILDTETTGLYDAEIVQIGIINLEGETLINTLVKPTVIIPDEVIAIHGITNKMVENAPLFPDIYPRLKDALFGKIAIIYNASFDKGIIEYCCRLHELEQIFIHSNCLMQYYAEYYGDWSNYHRSYRWKKLPNAKHSAIEDCLASLELLDLIANTPILPPEEIEVQFEDWWSKRDEREKEYQAELEEIRRSIEAGMGPF